MRSAQSPLGTYTSVEAIFRLKNGQTKIYQWTTPIRLSRALHKAPAWAKLEMRKARVKGRTQIVGIHIEAITQTGTWKRG